VFQTLYYLIDLINTAIIRNKKKYNILNNI